MIRNATFVIFALENSPGLACLFGNLNKRSDAL